MKILNTKKKDIMAMFAEEIHIIKMSAIIYASFANRVYVDPENKSQVAQPGVEYPTGTIYRPCSNLDDAIKIANNNGFSRIEIW